jgi:hypothetical protein
MKARKRRPTTMNRRIEKEIETFHRREKSDTSKLRPIEATSSENPGGSIPLLSSRFLSVFVSAFMMRARLL